MVVRKCLLLRISCLNVPKFQALLSSLFVGVILDVRKLRRMET